MMKHMNLHGGILMKNAQKDELYNNLNIVTTSA